jgi:hypothetical protein
VDELAVHRSGVRLKESGGFSEDEARRFAQVAPRIAWYEQVTPRVTFVTQPRTASRNLPAWRIVAARSAPHHYAVAFEVQHGVVPLHAAPRSTETRHGASQEAGSRRRALGGLRCCRELLGVVGYHWGSLLIELIIFPRTPVAVLPFLARRPPDAPRKYQEMCHVLATIVMFS